MIVPTYNNLVIKQLQKQKKEQKNLLFVKNKLKNLWIGSKSHSAVAV